MKNEEIATELNFIKKKPSIMQKGGFTSKEAVMVMVHEARETCSNSNTPVLGSVGAGPCVIVAIYDPINRQAILAHLDTSVTSRHYKPLFQWANEGKIEVHLYGGDNTVSSNKLIAGITRYIKQNSNITIQSAHIAPTADGLHYIGRDGAVLSDLAIDARTGEIFTTFSISQFSMNENAFKFSQDNLAHFVKTRQSPPLSMSQQPGCNIIKRASIAASMAHIFLSGNAMEESNSNNENIFYPKTYDWMLLLMLAVASAAITAGLIYLLSRCCDRQRDNQSHCKTVHHRR